MATGGRDISNEGTSAETDKKQRKNEDLKEEVENMRKEIEELNDDMNSLQRVLNFIKRQDTMKTSQTGTSPEEIEIRAILRQLREKVDSWEEEDDSLEEAEIKKSRDVNVTEKSKGVDNFNDLKKEIEKSKETQEIVPEITHKSIKLKHKCVYETGLCDWEYTRYVVMESTGDIVYVGKEEEDDPVALHIYKYKDGWQKIGTKPGPCIHSVLYILPIMIENNERLLVSCYTCNTIWFCNIYTGNFTVALKEERFYPSLMCKAEGDYIYIVYNVVGLSKPILKAKCTPTELSLDISKTIYFRMETLTSICYLPFVKCVAISYWSDHVVKAIHCETGEEVWEVKGKVAWEPHGLCYSPEHQPLLVCDASDAGRLVVLNPNDGSVLQVIPLPQLKLPWFLSLYQGNLIVHNVVSDGAQIHVFNTK